MITELFIQYSSTFVENPDMGKTVDLIFEPKRQSPPSLVGPSWMWTLRTFAVEWFLSCVGWCPDSFSDCSGRWNLQLNNLSLTRKWMIMAMSWWAPYSASLFAYSLIDLTFVRAYSGVHHVFQIRKPSTISLYHRSMTPGETRDICKFLQRIWSMGYHGICLSKVLLVREGLQDDAAVWLPCREL